MYFDLASGHSECETHHFTDGYLIAQHRREPRFTEVHRMASDHACIPGIHLYVHFDVVSRMPPGFGEFSICYCFQS